MFGSYRIDDRKDAPPRLGLRFAGGGEFNVYTCSVRFIDEPLDEIYDWSGDVMSDIWDAAAARRKLRAMPEALACDALLDQNVFAGVGNIIKNEVLFRIRLHPLAKIGALPPQEARPARRRGAPLQLRLPRMEEGLRPQEALARAHQADVPALRRSVRQGASRQDAAAQLLLRALPAPLRRLTSAAGASAARRRRPPGRAVQSGTDRGDKLAGTAPITSLSPCASCVAAPP